MSNFEMIQNFEPNLTFELQSLQDVRDDSVISQFDVGGVCRSAVSQYIDGNRSFRSEI